MYFCRPGYTVVVRMQQKAVECLTGHRGMPISPPGTLSVSRPCRVSTIFGGARVEGG